MTATGSTAIVEVTRETQNVLLLGASNGCWWLHEASPCNCWKKISRQMRTRKKTHEEFYAHMKRVGTLEAPNGGLHNLPGFLHSFFSSPARSNRKCCSGLFARDQGGRRRRSRRRSSPPPASTIWRFASSLFQTFLVPIPLPCCLEQKQRTERAEPMMMAMHLHWTFVLLCCKMEKDSILQLVDHVCRVFILRWMEPFTGLEGAPECHDILGL